MATDTIAHRIQSQASRQPNAPAYHVKTGGSWKMTTWRGYADQVRQAGKAMIGLGLEPGHAVCIIGFNRPEWTIFDAAAFSVGAVPAGIYTTSSAEEVRHVIAHSDAELVLVEDDAQWRKIAAVRDRLPALRHVITMRGFSIDDPIALTWDAFITRGSDVSDSAFDDRMSALRPDQLATLIYTSGTTGPSKGVMLSHENLAWTADCAQQITGAHAGDRAVSYLPLSHIAEQMFTIHVPATAGMSIWYAESQERVPDNLKEVQPTVFFGVPRVWEKFHAGVMAKLSQATGARAAVVRWARGVGAEVSARRMRGQPVSGALRLQHSLADGRLYAKIKAAIGLSNARVCVSGAAPIAREVLEDFASLGIVVHEVYGQSEGSGPTSFNLEGRARFGSVGPALPGVDVRIAEDDEILVRGPNVFLGYLKDADATAETLKDGWLCSGDLGKFDAEGFLHITGRKKEILITAGGKNITPKNVEAALKNIEGVNEAVMIGDKRKFCSALLTLDPDWVQRVAQARGVDPARIPEDPDVRALIQRGVDHANAEFARVEQIKKFAILPRNFTIADNELTPTLKIKRRIIAQNWAAVIEDLYAGEDV